MFNKTQNLRVLAAYTLAVVYSNVLDTISRANLHTYYIAYGALAVTLGIMFLLCVIYFKRIHEKGHARENKIVIVFISCALIGTTIRMLAFGAKPPSIYTYLTPFLSIVLFKAGFVYVLVAFMLILQYCLFLQHSVPSLVLYLFNGSCASVDIHFESLRNYITNSNTSNLERLVVHELPFIAFMLLLFYHFGSAMSLLKGKKNAVEEAVRESKEKSLFVGK